LRWVSGSALKFHALDEFHRFLSRVPIGGYKRLGESPPVLPVPDNVHSLLVRPAQADIQQRRSKRGHLFIAMAPSSTQIWESARLCRVLRKGANMLPESIPTVRHNNTFPARAWARHDDQFIGMNEDLSIHQRLVGPGGARCHFSSRGLFSIIILSVCQELHLETRCSVTSVRR
jgi:hypothetical protein